MAGTVTEGSTSWSTTPRSRDAGRAWRPTAARRRRPVGVLERGRESWVSDLQPVFWSLCSQGSSAAWPPSRPSSLTPC